MKDILYVGIGGFMGSVARFKAGALITHHFANAQFPWATFAVNVSGCFIVGIIAGILERTTHLNAEMRLLLITGFSGGFTTFSAFGIETLHLLRAGNSSLAILNAVASVVAGICAVWLGMRLTI